MLFLTLDLLIGSVLTVMGQVLQFCLYVPHLVFSALKLYSAPHAHQKGNILVFYSILSQEIVLLLAPLQRPLCIAFILHHNIVIILFKIPLIVEIVMPALHIDRKVVIAENVIIIFELKVFVKHLILFLFFLILLFLFFLLLFKLFLLVFFLFSLSLILFFLFLFLFLVSILTSLLFFKHLKLNFIFCTLEFFRLDITTVLLA